MTTKKDIDRCTFADAETIEQRIHYTITQPGHESDKEDVVNRCVHVVSELIAKLVENEVITGEQLNDILLQIGAVEASRQKSK